MSDAPSKEAFFAAVADGDLAATRELLERAPDLADVTDEEGRTGLLVAIYHGHHHLVNLLSERRTTVDVFEAAARGDVARVLELLREEPARAHQTSPDGFRPLGLAAFFGHPEVVEVLLEAGADPDVSSRNAMRVTPLHSGAACRDPEAALDICRALLRRGADPDATQAGGWTPLHQAAQHGNERLVDLLLEHGAASTPLSDDGRSPVEMARQRGHDRIVERLERAGGSAG